MFRFPIHRPWWSPPRLLGVGLGLLVGGYFAVGRIWQDGAASKPDSEPKEPRHRVAARWPTGVPARPPQISREARAKPPEQVRRASSPATDSVQEMESALTELAREEPHRAMALALADEDPILRATFRDAVLRGWAAAFQDAAAAWAMALPPGDHHSALEAVFAGAARQPEQAAELGARLAAQDPTLAGDFGQLLITALADAGAFEAAARFASREDLENRPAWTNVAFFKWAARQPEQAVRAFETIADSAERRAALPGLLAGWSEVNPAASADYALQLPAGANRAETLAQVLPQWVSRDPLAASNWLVAHYLPGFEWDAAAAAAAVLPHLVGPRPEIALVWAESIADPDLREEALRTIARTGMPGGAAAVPTPSRVAP